MIKHISSLTNPKVKFIGTLRNRRQRDKTRLSVAEGLREVQALLYSQLSVKELFVLKNKEKEFAQLIKASVARRIACYTLTPQVFAKVSYGDRKDGLLAVFETKEYLLADLPQKKNPLFVIAEGIEKPGNLGAILRTCDGAGVDGLIICETTTDVFNPNVIRASIGTVFSIPIAFTENQQALEFLKAKKIMVYAASPEATKLYSKVNFRKPSALVIGNEQVGLTPFWRNNADQKIKIPMLGQADSLNVSASAAILLYETLRQRNT